MKQFRTAFILIGVMAVLAVVTYWDDWKTKKDESAKLSENKLVAITEDQVSEIQYSSVGATDSFDKGGEHKTAPFEAHLKKVDGQWKLTAPIDTKADDNGVKTFLTTLKDYKFDKVLSEDKAQWKQYGLAPANRKITLSFTKDGKPGNLDIFVGSKAPVGYSAYVATSESTKVYLGSQHILTATAKTLADLRDKSVTSLSEKDLTGLTIENKGKDTVMVVKHDGKYAITAPEPLPADDMTVKDLVEELSRIKAADMIDHPSPDMTAKFSGKNLTGKLTWTTTGGSPTTLLFAENDKVLWAAYDPKVLIMKMPDDTRPKLFKSANELRDRKMFAFTAKDAASIEIDGLLFKKVGADWYAAEDAAKSPPQGKPKGYIQSLLVDLEFAKGEDFLSPTDKTLSAIGAPQRRIKIEFTSESKVPPLSIETWDDSGHKDKVLVKHSTSKYVYRTTKSLFANATETSIKSSPEAASPLNFGKADDSPGTKDDKSAN